MIFVGAGANMGLNTLFVAQRRAWRGFGHRTEQPRMRAAVENFEINSLSNVRLVRNALFATRSQGNGSKRPVGQYPIAGTITAGGYH